MLSVPVTTAPDGQLRLHATTVVVAGKALVIAGPSGVGKSALALRLIALGAGLIADDITAMTLQDGRLFALSPETLPPLIEVRGLGLLHAPVVSGAPVAAVLDLAKDAADRLPPHQSLPLLGQDAPLLHKPATPYIAEAMIHYLRYGRAA